MAEIEIDDVDRAILHALQEDARHNSNAAIAERIDISASTVGTRLDRLEAEGVVTGYRPTIDYELAGLPLEVLFLCSAPITERRSLVAAVLDIDGVVGVRELMTGTQNVHVKVVGASNEDITRIAREVDATGLAVTDEVLLKGEHYTPSIRFEFAPEG